MIRATDTNIVLDQVGSERARQDELWGEQNHPDGTSHILWQMVNLAREAADTAATGGYLTWAHILNEEFYEAINETDQTKLREELVQVAAVAVAWIECIDRRKHAAQEEVTR